jgi:DNA-binding NarL/FixJ family response regulator
MFEALGQSTLTALIAVSAVVLCVFVSISFKRDIRRIHQSYQVNRNATEVQLRALAGRLESLDQTVKELEKKTAAIPQLSPPKPGMTESRRVQVLRMYKRGERTEQIAAALGLPLNEVDLLVKVHQLVHPG